MIRPAPASLCARSHAMRVAWHGHRRACVQRGNRMLRLCAAPTDEELEVVEAEDEPFLIDEVDSELNDTVAVRQMPHHPDVPESLRGSRLLYLGEEPDEVLCSVYKPLGSADPMTYAYWDYYATFPLLLDEGPIGIYGFAGGTAARLILELYETAPKMVGWEADQQVLDLCEEHMGHKELAASGLVDIRKGDALSPNAGTVEGGFAGIIVDLTAGGRLVPELTRPEAWLLIRSRLSDPWRGKVMAHLGPAADEAGKLLPQPLLALNAMHQAFGGVCYFDPPRGSELSVMAVTGTLPPRRKWGARLGDHFIPFTMSFEPWVPLPIEVPGSVAGELQRTIQGSEQKQKPAGAPAAGRRPAVARRRGRLFSTQVRTQQQAAGRQQQGGGGGGGGGGGAGEGGRE